MELLINDLMKKGVPRSSLRAKVFGGGTSLSLTKEATYNIPKMNIEFIFGFLETERIPVDAYSVGGSKPRRIHFFPATGKVLMKYPHLGGNALARRESKYQMELREATDNAGRSVLF
jgi:chemotaxis protein CheD